MKFYYANAWTRPFFAYPKIYDGSTWNYGVPKVWLNPSSTDSTVVTVGISDQTLYLKYGNNLAVIYYGYIATYTSGSLTRPNSLLYAAFDGLPISGLYYNNNFNGDTVTLNIPGAPNSGWTTLTINGYAYPRTSASYISGVWSWDPTQVNPGVNPFGTTAGVNIPVSWS